LQISQIAGRIESAFDHDARAGKVRGQIGAKTLRANECSCARGRGCGIGFCELHYDRADSGIHIDGIVVARKLAVEIKSSAGPRSCDNGDGRPLLRLHRGTSGKIGSAAAFGAEAGQGDNSAAATNVHSRNRGRARGNTASAPGTGSRRNAAARIQVGSVAGSRLARACAFSGQGAARPFAMNQACTSAGTAKARFVATGRRHGERAFAPMTWYAHVGAGLCRYNHSSIVAGSACALGRSENRAGIAGSAEAETFSARTGDAVAGADRWRRRNNIARNSIPRAGDASNSISRSTAGALAADGRRRWNDAGA